MAALSLTWSAAAISADFVAVRIEAEDFSSKSDRWALTSDTETPNLGPDPDPSHHASASGRANLELLPDTRVTHDDTVYNGGMDGNFWGGPGGGPRVDYLVNMPEAGRYLVWVKTFSTGTEDNGIHVAINGTLPASGQRVQICSKHNWFWTSGQRTNDNHCGVRKTIWLDVPAAGVNTITFFAREDGFEIDQFMLMKETHDGSKDCFPTFNDKVRCRDANTGATLSDTVVPFSQTVASGTNPPPPTTQPTLVDLDIDINVIGNTHYVDDIIEYRIKATNQDTTNNATGVVAVSTIPSDLEFEASADCTHASGQVTCDFGGLATSASETLSFTARVVSEGNHRVDSQISADQDDAVSNNDTDSATINASYSIPDYEAGISMQQDRNAITTGGSNNYTVNITNNGLQSIDNATINVTAGAGLTLEGCNPSCNVPPVASGETTSVSFTTNATIAGASAVTAILQLTDDADPANNTATATETVLQPSTAITDNGQMVVEAESFSSNAAAAVDNAPNWFLINDQFSALPTSLDPDQTSPANASGGAYVELLPDYRIDDNQSNSSGVSNFGTGGTGATLSYDVFFSEAGEYSVFALMRSNNSQDASLHVGINNSWLDTTLAICNPDGTWQWTSGVKSDTGCQSDGMTNITVNEAGMHTLMLSQDTDGLELDKLVVARAPATLPSGTGPAATTFDATAPVDVSVSGAFSSESITPNASADFTVTVSNASGAAEAVGLMVTLDGLETGDIPAGVFDSCASTATGIACSLTTLAIGAEVSETFTVSPGTPITVNASVTTATQDNNAANNTTTAALKVEDAPTQANSSGGGSTSLWMLLTILILSGVRAGIWRTRTPALVVLQKDQANTSLTAD